MTKAERIVLLRGKGLTYGAIADKCKCGIGYVNAALQRHRAGGPRECDKAWRDNNREHIRDYDLRRKGKGVTA